MCCMGGSCTRPAKWQHHQLSPGSSDDALGTCVRPWAALPPLPPPRPTPDQLAVMLHLLPLEGGVRWGEINAVGSYRLPTPWLARSIAAQQESDQAGAARPDVL